MIELKENALVFSFPEVYEDAAVSIGFQRTLRIPDDDGHYPLPPGLGRFPLRHVDDFARRLPPSWLRHGGVMLPMYQSEAVWLNFSPGVGPGAGFGGHGDYPFAVKIATGKINAVTGEPWSDGLHRDPQDYVVVPEQPWLDGYAVEKGVIRQFVATPLGAGYSVEEQLSGAAEHGGVQIVAYPMKREAYERIRPRFHVREQLVVAESAQIYDMGLAPGGRMRQEIYDDPYEFEDWDTRHGSRCFVHLANALLWRAITGEQPPTVPPTAKEYTTAGLPWFEYYAADVRALEGSETLSGLKSVAQMGAEKGDVPLPENESVNPERIVKLRKRMAEDQVREGAF